MGEGSNKAGLALALAAVCAAAGVGFGLKGRGPVVSGEHPTSTIASSHEGIDVHVSGWVVSPGVVTVAKGSIAADAIAAAGGLRAGANASALNLAAPVGPGNQIVVPGPGPAPETGVGSEGRLLSLSRATVSELETLPGVGPVLAERIASFRDERGGFTSVEELLEVPGIGESTLASIRDLVVP